MWKCDSEYLMNKIQEDTAEGESKSGFLKIIEKTYDE
jgi:hypothetical protein